MGLVSFLCWVWSSGSAASLTPTPDPLSAPHLRLHEPSPSLKHPPAPVHAFRKEISVYHDTPPSPKRLTFTLPTQIYAWLEAMAVLHNYGSVHKSIRDLLAWASAGRHDDMEWLFGTPHEVPPCFHFDLECATEASVIAGTQCARGGEVVMVDARLSDGLYGWIVECVDGFALGGPSAVLDAVCRCAIELHAADDIFESDESGHDLPATSAELYHDLGIIRSCRSEFSAVRTGCS